MCYAPLLVYVDKALEILAITQKKMYCEILSNWDEGLVPWGKWVRLSLKVLWGV